MAFPSTNITSQFTDSQGVGIDSIFNAAADRILPVPKAPESTPPPVPTLEERIQAIEEQKMATAASTPDFNSPEYWNRGLPQQPQHQAPAQQVIIPQGEELKKRLPKTYEELAQMQQQTTLNVLSQAQQMQMAIQETEGTLRNNIRNHPELTQWEDVAVSQYQNLVRSGVPREQAYRQSVHHVQHLKGQGLSVSRPRIPNPNQGGTSANGDPGPFRPDEAGMKNRIGFYSEEDRIKDAKESIHDRFMDSEYYKTRGAFGRSMQEKHAHLFNVE